MRLIDEKPNDWLFLRYFEYSEDKLPFCFINYSLKFPLGLGWHNEGGDGMEMGKKISR